MLDARGDGGVLLEGDAESPSHAVHGEIVVGRSHSAGGEDEIELRRKLPHLVSDEIDLVRNRQDPLYVDPKLAELTTQVR